MCPTIKSSSSSVKVSSRHHALTCLAGGLPNPHSLGSKAHACTLPAQVIKDEDL